MTVPPSGNSFSIWARLTTWKVTLFGGLEALQLRQSHVQRSLATLRRPADT